MTKNRWKTPSTTTARFSAAASFPLEAQATKDEIDAIISKYLKKGWTLRRISRPSLAILRLAVYEITYLESIPDAVSVNEAVELAKKYTIDESGFVNGILGSVVRAKGEQS